MRQGSRIAAAAVAASLLAACGSGGAGVSNPADGGTSRAFTRNDGAVTSTYDAINNRYTATQVITLSNDDAGASQGIVSLSTDSGSVTSTTNASGYQIQVTLTATAPTDQQARDALATMSVSHRDATSPGVLYLDTHVSVPSYSANNVNRDSTMVAALPSLSYALAEQADAGSVASSGLQGTSARMDLGAGNATLGGTWDSATMTTGSGSITVTADAAGLSASTGVGSVTATLPSTRATHATLDTNIGPIDVTVSHAGSGVFDADARSDNGSASVSIAGTSPDGSQTSSHAHYRSPSYASGDPKIAVQARASTGSASIHD